jgi:hypothetical protein
MVDVRAPDEPEPDIAQDLEDVPDEAGAAAEDVTAAAEVWAGAEDATDAADEACAGAEVTAAWEVWA